jgi:perosamine synthetase
MQEDKLIELARSIKNPENKYNGNELYYIAQVLDWENHQDETPFAIRFEKAFAKRFGVKFAIGHNSGTSTLHSCLAASDIGSGDEVICPAQSCLMNPMSTMHNNSVPVFADIDEETFNIDPKDIKKKITNKTKAIQVAHMHGLPADMDEIMNIAKENNLVVIEDAAQCVLGYYKGKLAGTIGHMHSWSFETKKHLSTGEGGMVTTDDEELGTKIRKNAGLGYKILSAGEPMKKTLPEEFQDPDYKRHDRLGWNYRLNEVTSALGLAQLERIDELVTKRQKCAELLLDTFSSCDWILPQKVPKDYVNAYFTFTARFLGNETKGITWKDFYNEYKSLGGDGFYGAVSVSYLEPTFTNKQYLKSGYFSSEDVLNGKLDYNKGICPVAEKVQSQMMSFKTNYRNLDEAKNQNLLLKKTIDKFK